MKRRLLSLALTAAIAAAGLPGIPAMAAPTAMPQSTAVRILQDQGVVDRVPESLLRLEQTITRAEMAKMLGATMLLQKEADAAREREPLFADTRDHWANGWITVAREHGLFLGRDDGRFYPQDPVTYAEVITVLLRVTGRGLHAQFNWPWGAITTAAEFGMIPADMSLGGRMFEPATRGDVFRLTAVAIGRTPMAGSAETLLQLQGDHTPPSLELIRIPSVTGDWHPILTGRTVDAVSVAVDGQPAEMLPDGSFSAQVNLVKGENSITFRAVDGAGNTAERRVQIVLQTVARLEFSVPVIETAVGQTFRPTLFRIDAQGLPAPADEAAWTYDANALQRDPATGLFRAVQPGEYTLRARVDGAEAAVQVVVAGAPAQLQITSAFATVVAGGAPVAITVRVLDAEGRLVTSATNQVQLSAIPTQGGSFDQPMVTLKGGKATAYLSPGQAVGGLGIQATINGTAKLSSPVLPLNVEARRFSGVQLTTLPPNAKPTANQSVTVVASAVDQVGSPIAVRDDTPVLLSLTGEPSLQLSRGTVTIKAGNSTSENTSTNGLLITTGNSGKAVIHGTVGYVPVTSATFLATPSGEPATLEVTVLREAAPADKLSAALVTVTRRDALGNVVADARTPVVLFSKTGGVSTSLISDSGGVALFAIRSGTPGRMEVAAGLPGRPELNTNPVAIAFVQSTGVARPVLRTTSRSATAGEAVPVYVSLEGGSGQVLGNPGPPLRFQLSAPNATLTSTELTIPTGATRSGDVVVNIPNGVNMVTVSGSMLGGDALTPASISVLPPPPAVPETVPTGLNLVAAASTVGRPPLAGEEVRFSLRVRNGANQLSGGYAIGLKVLIGGREVTGPVPGLTIKSGPRDIAPDGVVRTTNGETEIWLRYTGIGTVEVQPVGVAAAYDAPDQWGVTGPADATATFRSVPARLTYGAGPLARMSVQVGPNLGDLSQGVIKAARGRFATIRLAPVDQYGNPAGSNCLATLTQVRVSPTGALVLRSGATDVTERSQSIGTSGYADFIVAATTDGEATSEWSPFIICGNTPLTAPKITVNATVHAAPTPTIEFAGGTPSTPGTVRATDPGLDLRIGQLTNAPASAEVLVYDGTVLLGRFGPVQATQANQSLRTVRVPISLLAGASRTLTLRVRIHSGADVSEESGVYYVYYTP